MKEIKKIKSLVNKDECISSYGKLNIATLR